MKKNPLYIQTCVLNEVIKNYSPFEIATAFLDAINKKDVECTIYETHTDGMVFRKKRDCEITDEMIVKAFLKTIRTLVDKRKDDLVDKMLDLYEFEYKKDDMTEDFIEDALLIRRSGRLISIELDIQ